MLRRLSHLAKAVALLVAPASLSHSRIIDDFTEGPITVTGPQVIDQVGLDPAHVLGGERRLDVGANGEMSTLTVSPLDGLRLTSPTDSKGYLIAEYGGATPLGGVDLTANGDNRLIFFFGDLGGGFQPLSIGMWSTTSIYSSHTNTIIDGAWDGVIVEAPYAASGLANADFANTDRFVVNFFRSPAGSGLQLEAIKTGRRELVGDFNYDGVVNADDLQLWVDQSAYDTRFSLTNGWRLSADANEDGKVSGADFLAWQRNVVPQAPSTSVPEPATWTWVVVAFLFVVLRLVAASGRKP